MASDTITSDKAAATKEREGAEDKERLDRLNALKAGPSKEALEELINAAEAFIAASDKLRGITQEGMSFHPGRTARELLLPLGQEDRLAKIRKEMEWITTTELRHHLPPEVVVTRRQWV